MPIYEFLCLQDHRFERLSSLSAAHQDVTCPDCGNVARRVMSRPSLAKVDPAKRRAVETAQQTAEKPEVVSRLPAGQPEKPVPVSTNPLHAKLPRP